MQSNSSNRGKVRKGDLVGETLCPHCEIDGVVDYVDLVRGVSTLHCSECSLEWKMEIQAPMDYLAN